MKKEDIVNAIADIDKKLEELHKCYEPYVGMSFEEMSSDDRERILKFVVLLQQLTYAKAELRRRATYEFHIFVM